MNEYRALVERYGQKKTAAVEAKPSPEPLSSKNPTWNDLWLNWGLHGERPVTKHVSQLISQIFAFENLWKQPLTTVQQ
jgi:hypothetical protein